MRTALVMSCLGLLLSVACGSSPVASRQTGAAHSPAATITPIGDGSPAPAGGTPAGTAPAGPSPGSAAAPGGAGAPSAANRPGPTPSLAPVAAGTVVTSWNSPGYGEILVAGNGHVLYLFTPDDATGTNTCNCPSTWPPLSANAGAPRAQGQVKQSLLGVSGGQVTYNGHPLYFYYMDSAPDEAKGQGSGEVWYVVTVNGNACTSATCT